MSNPYAAKMFYKSQRLSCSESRWCWVWSACSSNLHELLNQELVLCKLLFLMSFCAVLNGWLTCLLVTSLVAVMRYLWSCRETASSVQGLCVWLHWTLLSASCKEEQSCNIQRVEVKPGVKNNICALHAVFFELPSPGNSLLRTALFQPTWTVRLVWLKIPFPSWSVHAHICGTINPTLVELPCCGDIS